MYRRLSQKMRLCLAVLVCLCGALPVAAAPRFYVPTVPTSMDDLDFFLTTGGIGHEVADRFGHTGIRVINRLEATDVVFNWGQYSFEDPAFLWRFFRGQLDYSMGVRTLEHDVGMFAKYGRLLRMEHLNLSAKQKRFLMDKIAWNAVPEHRRFAYQYWYKNCATIPRDYFNEALGGAIFQRFGTLPAGKVYRDYVRTNLAYAPFVVPILDVLMNSNIDHPITAWQDMFLPTNLRAWLLQMPAIDDNGQEIPGVKLLADSSVLNQAAEDFTPLLPDYPLVVAPLVLSSLAALGLFLRRLRRGPAAPLAPAYRLLGFATLYWGLIGGVLGLTLLINWGFSGHPDGWHNTNLLLFWPIDLVFIPLGWRLLRSRTSLLGQLKWLDLRRFCLLHVLSLFLLWGLTAAHVLEQNIWLASAWFGLPLLLLMAVLGWFGAAPQPLGRSAEAWSDGDFAGNRVDVQG